MKQKSLNTENVQSITKAMHSLKVNANQMITEEQSKSQQYKEKFNQLIAEVDSEFQFNPDLNEEVEKINKELKEKAEKISEVIKVMDDDYKSKIEGLRAQVEDQDSSMKDRFAAVKEKSSVVDSLKKENFEMKQNIGPKKMKANIFQGKIDEYSGVLRTTGDSIAKYKIEVLKIAKKIQKQLADKKDELDTKTRFKQAVMSVFQENQTLETKLIQETEKTQKSKDAANRALSQYAAKKSTSK